MARKHISLKTKLAATLLMMVRPGKDGRMVPVIAFDQAKRMTVEDILAKFEFDHSRYVALDGDNHPTNLTPLLRAEHREKTKRDLANIAKVKRGVAKRAGKKRKGRAIPGSKGTRYQKKMSGEVVLR